MGVDAIVLLGSDHTELGEVAVRELPPTVAIGISRGRFPKGYAHVDPNEDATLAATDGITTILAVADGHQGTDAAAAAILAISDAVPGTITADLESIIRAVTMAAITSIATTIPGLEPPRNTSRTALTVCAVRGSALASATIGDTSCFVTSRRRSARIGWSTAFLDPDTDPASIHVDSVVLPSKSSIVVASDGFTDFVASVHRGVRAASKQPPSSAVRALIADAFAGGAGDNIAVAVFTPPS